MRETGTNWVSTRLYAIFFAVFIIVATSLSITNIAHAQEAPTPDTTAPKLTANINGGDVYNAVTFRLNIEDEHLDYASIRVLGADEKTFDPSLVSESNNGASSLSLQWLTRGVADGVYKVRYTAIDTLGHKTEETKDVRVGNNNLNATLLNTATGHTIGGEVTRAGVDLAVQVDGQNVVVTPKIAPAPGDTGTYIWSADLPAELAVDKAYVVSVKVTDPVTAQESALVSQLITLSAPPSPVASPNESQVSGESPVVITPVLNFAKEIGQFIAPIIPIAPETKLFGIPTTDLTDDLQKNATPPPAGALSLSSGNKPADDQEEYAVAPVKPSQSGWMLLGVEWYWILVIAIVVGGAVFAAAKFFQQRQVSNAREVFARAESLQ